MRRLLLSILCLFCAIIAQSQDSMYVTKINAPILINKPSNFIYELKFNSKEAIGKLDNITIEFDSPDQAKNVISIKVYYTGTRSMLAFEPVMGKSYDDYMNPNYSIKKYDDTKIKRVNTVDIKQQLVSGGNYFAVAVELNPKMSLDSKIGIRISSATITNKKVENIENVSSDYTFNVGVGFNDMTANYSRPSFELGRKGTSLVVFEKRRYTQFGNTEPNNIAMTRSDNGVVWEPLRVIADMENWGGLPLSQNSLRVPALIRDVNNNKWMIALWMPGIDCNSPFESSNEGVLPEARSAQVMVTKSADDGKKWSAMANITKQIKNPRWKIIMPASSNGIVMSDKTIVLPVRIIDANGDSFVSIIYSKDQGANWSCGNLSQKGVISAAVVEKSKGEILIIANTVDGKTSYIASTDDMGASWNKYNAASNSFVATHGGVSAIRIDADKNFLKQDVIVACVNAKLGAHTNVTLRASIDGGETWNKKYTLVLDDQNCGGYCSMVLLDNETIAIIYEASMAELVYAQIKLKDIFKTQ